MEYNMEHSCSLLKPAMKKEFEGGKTTFSLQQIPVLQGYLPFPALKYRTVEDCEIFKKWESPKSFSRRNSQRETLRPKHFCIIWMVIGWECFIATSSKMTFPCTWNFVKDWCRYLPCPTVQWFLQLPCVKIFLSNWLIWKVQVYPGGFAYRKAQWFSLQVSHLVAG